ncbi:MAG: hypothetical protein KGL39_37115 [Patescibacteria group bacterium]|nr:hypothetical protein [Patescibacteria group bacterium]
MSDYIERMMEKIKFHRLVCAGLIDQDRFIGGDPVGHKCTKLSTTTVWRNGLNWRLCDDCAALFRGKSPRLTLHLCDARAGAE